MCLRPFKGLRTVASAGCADSAAGAASVRSKSSSVSRVFIGTCFVSLVREEYFLSVNNKYYWAIISRGTILMLHAISLVTKMSAFMVALSFTLAADEVFTQISDNTMASALAEKAIGILPVVVGDSIKMKALERISIPERKIKAESNFWRYFPSHCTYYSRFSAAVICTSNIVYTTARFSMSEGRDLTMPVPANDSLPACGQNQSPRFWLILEIPYIYDDVSSLAVNLWFFTGQALSPVEQIPEEECIHYVCKFVIWDRATHAAACYGYVTAQECGLSRDRYGPDGYWDRSLSDLAEQVFEDTPFKMVTQ
jgi:hypothetical protein